MVICEAQTIAGSVAGQEEGLALDLLPLPPQSPTARDCADIMGVLIDRTRRDQVISYVDSFVQSGRPHQIVTVNVDFLNIAHRDRSFVQLLNDAALAVPDGMPLVWVSQIVGRRLPERITGTDLLCDCAALAARKGYRLFLLGAAPGVADAAADLLSERYPGLAVVGTYSPPECGEFTPQENAKIVELVRAARPEMLFVALGTPKQEKWIYQNLQDLGVPVCIGVGGVFNFITGRIPRAPQPLQRAGLEWLFRLLLEPRRLWRRYLVDDTRALSRALLYALRKPRPGSDSRRDGTPAVAGGSLSLGAAAMPLHPRHPEPAEWHLAAPVTGVNTAQSVSLPPCD